LLAPIINIVEQISFTASSIDPLPTLERIANRYLWCDYGAGVHCQSPKGVGAFDSLINTTILLFLFWFIVTLIPGTGMAATMIVMFLALPVYFWIGYDAAPLCTLPSFFGGIPGWPVCAVQDAYELVQSLISDCAPIPVGLIDPADLARASRQLCASNSAPPPNILLCSQAAGFIDGFDNVGFSIASIFSQDAVALVADAVRQILPYAGDVIASYTDARLASLAARDQLGAICNFITFGNIVGALIVTGVAVVLASTLISLNIIITALLVIAIIFTVFAINVVRAQVRRARLERKRAARRQKVKLE
jgi:hypothetical protein